MTHAALTRAALARPVAAGARSATRNVHHRLLVVGVLLGLVLGVPPATAQTANQAQLRLVVVDQTGAGIPAATITITAGSGQAVTITSDERGLATAPALPVGAVTIHVEFPGFEPRDTTLTLRRGANNQTMTLVIAGVQEDVVVSDITSTDDRRGNALSTTLEQDDIEELPDDPDELAEVLRQMTGGAGATFSVNGFRGGRLPARDEIRQIRFRTNSFSADNHDAGRTQIEIITRPNVRQWSGNANFGLRNDVLNARNAFARAETPEQFRRFTASMRGPIVAGKTSIRLNLDGNRSYDSPTIFALNENGSIFQDSVRRPNESTNVTTGIEHALSNNQTLRIEYRRSQNQSRNQGVGDFTLPERAVERNRRDNQFRFQVQGLIGKTTLNEIRVQVNQESNDSSSLSTAPSINVLDAFNKGGAGVSSVGSSRTFEVADNLDFNIGRKHAMRVGLMFEGGTYDNFDARNAAGTFTFSSREAYLAGLPLQFTQRFGQVDTSFSQYQLGLYWQDDIRVNSAFSFSLGVRQEAQSLIDDKVNLMPRLGFTWSPFGARTVLRGGWGTFYDWYDSSLYDQTLRVNGVSQRDLLIINPGYPDPFAGAAPTVLPGGRVQAASGLEMPFIHQASIGMERPITQNLQLQASYQMLRGRNLMRARNINAPNEFGVRPEPTVGTVTQFESTGRSKSDRLTLSLNYRVPQTRIFMGGNYTLGQVLNHADGATQLPANSLDPESEWGPSFQDVRHRMSANINVPAAFGIRASVNANAQSSSPYNITTGRDDNVDGVVNDRPIGVSRNSARGEPRFDMSLRLTRNFGFGGTRPTPGAGPGQGGQAPGGPRGGAGGGRQGGGPGADGGAGAALGGLGGGVGGGTAQQLGQGGPGGPGGPGGGGGGFLGGANQRFTVEAFVSANNVLNRVNYVNFVGNQLSPFFGRATSAAQSRRVEIGMNFRF
jgi:hypothetical protein